MGSSLGPKAAPALVSVGDSSKHMIQIVQLLEERSMSFSFCLNKADVVILCGVSLLYQCIELKKDSKLVKDNEKLVNSVIKINDKAKTPGSYDFKRVSGLLISLEDDVPSARPGAELAAPAQRASPPATLPKKKPSMGRNPSAGMSETELVLRQEKLREMTMHKIGQTRPCFENVKQDPQMHHAHRMSMSHGIKPRLSPSLSNPPSSASSPTAAGIQPPQPGSHVSGNHHLYPNGGGPMNQKVGGAPLSEWETLLGSLDGGSLNVYDAIYGGPQISLDSNPPSAASVGPAYSPWSPDSWDLTNFNLGDLNNPAPPQSVLSLSDESLSSGGEELAPSELGLSVGSLDFRNQHGGMMHANGDNFVLEGIDGNFGL